MESKVTRITQCGQCGKSFNYIYNMENISAETTHYRFSCPSCQTKQRIPLHSVHKVEVQRDGKQQEIVVLKVPEHPVGVVEENPSQSPSS